MAFIPLALFGGALWEGMAYAMIAGLSFATSSLSLVIPVLYYTFFRRGALKAERAARKAAAAAALLLALGCYFFPSSAQAQSHPLGRLPPRSPRPSPGCATGRTRGRGRPTTRTRSPRQLLPLGASRALGHSLGQAQTLAIDTAAIGLPLDLPEFTLANQNVYIAKLNLTLPIYVGGKRFTGLAAAEYGTEARSHVVRRHPRWGGLWHGRHLCPNAQAPSPDRAAQARLQADELMRDAAQAKLDAELGTAFDVSLAKTLVADDPAPPLSS